MPMGVHEKLTREEVRVLGCLLEKAVVTPDQYPLTLNALTNACNQKSSREPVMSLEQGAVQRVSRQLAEKHLVSETEGKNNVSKYSQRICNTLLGKTKLEPAEYAIITLAMLRGPQTPGEFRSRSGRLHTFDDNQAVKDVLQSMIDREDPLMARLPKRAGRQDHEYVHLFYGEVDSVPEEEGVQQRTTASVQRESRVEVLEARVEKLEAAVRELAQRLGEEVSLD